MNWFKKIADNRETDSLATQMRRKRFGIFLNLIQALPKPVRIIDLGGSEIFWKNMGLAGNRDYQITLVNLETTSIQSANVKMVQGDVTHLGEVFSDSSFDVVFSNSVIEHVGDFDQQNQMAREVRRLAPRYFVQTPNLYFPIEPHFVFPCFQFLPVKWRVFLVRHFKLGWFPKTPNTQQAEALVRSIQLLSLQDLKKLFPEARFVKEKFLFLTKSWMVYEGF